MDILGSLLWSIKHGGNVSRGAGSRRVKISPFPFAEYVGVTSNESIHHLCLTLTLTSDMFYSSLVTFSLLHNLALNIVKKICGAIFRIDSARTKEIAGVCSDSH
jgi:hypothetical protein